MRLNIKIELSLKTRSITWWKGVDSDHRSDNATDLQSAPFGRSGTLPYEAKLGCWWAFTDSNRGPTGYEPVALTN